MGKIKDNLGLGKTQTVTLQPSEIKFLLQTRTKLQQELDKILQGVTSDFLHYVAVNRFEYPPDCDLRFNLNPDRSENNLDITVVPHQ